MPSISLYINDAALDSNGNVWCVGRDLSKYDGSSWNYFDYSNSIVPSNSPYYLDTRSISINPKDEKWVGCAVSAGLSQTIVFEVTDSVASSGKSWEIADFGLTASPNWDCPTIFASPFGEEVLAFISPLNGGGGTGATGNIGVTGGYLFRYNRQTENWKEVAPGYTWPHIYQIAAKGEGGDSFSYYLCTEEGLQIIPTGTLYYEELFDGTKYIPQIRKFDSSNSSLDSDVVYSISFDENGNYWLGTENYLSYWDGQKFYNWSVNGNPVTEVRSRSNGHVFFKIGDPFSSPSITNGLYHFNGDTFTLFDSSNSSLPDDLVIKILLVEEKKQSPPLTAFPQDLWLVSGNFVVLFDYQIPHIYATSKYTGTTGWNFVYYTPTTEGTTGDEARLPKANKYTWDYPSWRSYQNFDLAYQHPGLDPRNLFLEADFSAIASGEAGEQPYWNNSPIPTYEDSVLAQQIPDSKWIVGITGSSQVEISGVTRFNNLNVVYGYTNNQTVDFGTSNNLVNNSIFTNPNPTTTLGGTADVGFVSFYSDSGEFQGVIPFRGDSTRVLSASPSRDGNSLIVLGSYSGYIEGGKFIWGSEYPTAGSLTITGVTGPTGGPIGFSNIATPGITGSFDYPWILNGPTGATSGVYIPDTSLITSTSGIFVADVDFDLGSEVSYGGIDFSIDTISKSFALKNFRTFPGVDSSFNPLMGPTGILPTSVGTSDLSVSLDQIRFSTNLTGGIATLKNDYLNLNDTINAPEFLFSEFSGPSYLNGGIVVQLDSNFYLQNGNPIGLTGSSSEITTISSLINGQTYLLTGTSTTDVSLNGLVLSHTQPGFSYPWYMLVNSNGSGITGSIIKNSSSTGASYQTWINTVNGFTTDNSYYTAYLYTGNSTVETTGGSSIGIGGKDGSVNVGVLSITPGGIVKNPSSFELLPDTYQDAFFTQISDVQSSENSNYYISVYYPLPTGPTGAHSLIKRSLSGTYIDEISTFALPSDANLQDTFKFHVSSSLDIFIAGSSNGITGPSDLPYPSGDLSFVSFLESYKIKTGIDLGNIISRAGSEAWSWVDVHSSKSDIFVPLLSTVFFSNYDSRIFGKNNNRWVLSNSLTGEVILDVKNVPYFIYTFAESGYYTIQNSVEDSNGNVYEVSKPAFVKVMNQSIPSESDPNPEFVNSADYGYIELKPDRNSQFFGLDKDLVTQQIEILAKNVRPFSSGLNLTENPDATFNPL
jgi:hypothetical protein